MASRRRHVKNLEGDATPILILAAIACSDGVPAVLEYLVDEIVAQLIEGFPGHIPIEETRSIKALREYSTACLEAPYG